MPSWQPQLSSHFFVKLFFPLIFVVKLKLEQEGQLLEQLEQLELVWQLEQKLELLTLGVEQELVLAQDRPKWLFQLSIHQLQPIVYDVQSSLFRNLILLEQECFQNFRFLFILGCRRNHQV